MVGLRNKCVQLLALVFLASMLLPFAFDYGNQANISSIPVCLNSDNAASPADQNPQMPRLSCGLCVLQHAGLATLDIPIATSVLVADILFNQSVQAVATDTQIVRHHLLQSQTPRAPPFLHL